MHLAMPWPAIEAVCASAKYRSSAACALHACATFLGICACTTLQSQPPERARAQGFPPPDLLPAVLPGQNVAEPFPGYANNPDLATFDPETNSTYVTTPLVTDFACTFFDCPAFFGAAVEDDGSQGSSGKHWETRIFQARIC
jgi:Leishmanolysin